MGLYTVRCLRYPIGFNQCVNVLMAAFAKIFSDLVTSEVSTVATWQIGSVSPKVCFGYIVHILISYCRANKNAAIDRSPTNP